VPIYPTPLIPFIPAMVLALLTYLPNKTGKLMYSFQDPENIYELETYSSTFLYHLLNSSSRLSLGYSPL